MVKCIHLIPLDGLGGVEVAARSFIRSACRDEQVDLRVMYLARGGGEGGQAAGPFRVIPSAFASTNNPAAHLLALFRIIMGRPEVLVCSLWKCMPIGICYKLLFPGKKFVCFLHSAKNVHWVDRVLTNLAIRFADAVWGDSEGTLLSRLPRKSRKEKRLRIISFVLESHYQRSLPRNVPSFVFWGRLHFHKGLDLALQLFAAIVRRNPLATYTIYGPDAGEEGKLRALAAELGLSRQVRFMGVTSFEELKSSAAQFGYYLQLSRLEGMAISVVEAMQLGLVPVVTPVGEISNYCNNHNSVLIEDLRNLEQYADCICKLLDNDVLHDTLRDNSLRTWNNPVTYSTDIVAALHELIPGQLASCRSLCQD
jgi:glycosyltransferase involved in cell wall biosynthesis